MMFFKKCKLSQCFICFETFYIYQKKKQKKKKKNSFEGNEFLYSSVSMKISFIQYVLTDKKKLQVN